MIEDTKNSISYLHVFSLSNLQLNKPSLQKLARSKNENKENNIC